jgi:IcmF-related N-terminal domain
VYFVTNLLNSITMPIRSIYSWIVNFTPGLKGILRVSLPTRIALMTLLFLVLIYTAALVSYSRSNAADHIFQFIIAFPFIIIIPVTVFYLVKFWMIKKESRFPDIDRVWQGGVVECDRNGIDIDNVPLFLVLGTKDNRQAASLMKSSQLAINVSYPPREDADIIFFANSDAIYLFINGCSCISRLSSAPNGSPNIEKSQPVSDSISGTIDSSMFATGLPGNRSSVENVSQTLSEAAFVGASGSMQPAAAGVGGTMLLPEGGLAEYMRGGRVVPETPRTPQLSSMDIVDREQKLRYLCSLIVKTRQPLCPINGLITTLPFDLIESASSQVQTAAQKDLAILRDELLVRCANTILVTQMERDEGFQELIKRVGEDRSRDNRFGKGCELWNAPEGARLDAIAAHAVGAFEDWIYMLFQEDSALKHRYNSRLFMLLCRIRGRFGENLRAVLARGFGFDPLTEGHLAYEQFLFGGCYFAATGAEPGRQAFVKSVFLKGIEKEGELEWAPEARNRDRQLQFAANLFALVGMLSFLAIVGMLVFQFALPPR